MGFLVKTIRFNIRPLKYTINCGILVKRTITKQPSNQTKLAEVGRLESPKLDGKYETGQLFLHRIFGYRGVVLFPWTARVYDRDLHHPNKQKVAQKTKLSESAVNTSDGNVAEAKDSSAHEGAAAGFANASESTTNRSATAEATAAPTASNGAESKADATSGSASSSSSNTGSASAGASGDSSSQKVGKGVSATSRHESPTREVKGKKHTFYQVLIDSRDCPYIRAQTEAVTFLGNQDSNRSLYAIPGLDYVAHDDIMPYVSAEKHPLHHELFDKFLTHVPGRDPPFVAQDTLIAWQDKNNPWLELSDVHKETTENIRITVTPFYMGCRETPASSVYWWRYSIRLENLGQLSVQLRERHWRIFSLSGTLETVRGRGVVGQEPILSPRLPAFQYSSHVSLQAPSGHMWGTFRLEREDGYTFDCKIPPFSLESKSDDGASGQTSKRDDTE